MNDKSTSLRQYETRGYRLAASQAASQADSTTEDTCMTKKCTKQQHMEKSARISEHAMRPTE